jgi:hypothetical protein
MWCTPVLTRRRTILSSLILFVSLLFLHSGSGQQTEKEEELQIPFGAKLRASSEQKSDEVTIGSKPAIRTVWQQPKLQFYENSELDRWKLAGLSQEIVPLRYTPETVASLIIELLNVGPYMRLENLPAELTVRNKYSDSGDEFKKQLPATFRKKGGRLFQAVLALPANELLKNTGSLVNQNALQAKVKIKFDSIEIESETNNLLHILKQKLILFIPGVCGSRITVRSHPREEAYPALSFFHDSSVKDTPHFVPINWLYCRADGSPVSSAYKLDLLRTYPYDSKPGYPVYRVEGRSEIENPPGHKQFFRVRHNTEHPEHPFEYPIPYYFVTSWPYDWRLKLEYAVDLLMGRGQGRDPTDRIFAPYIVPPSLALLTKELRQKYFPFFDDRIAIAAHSTGGLITRAVLKQPGIEKYVDKAFFIDVPFWGAPKAYWIFLTGDMGLDFIQKRFMRDLSPNTPIVYYLSPTENYPDYVAKIEDRVINREKDQSVGSFMNELVTEARQKGLYPMNVDSWNEQLELAAKAFHSSIQGPPRIGYRNCIVFWSYAPAAETAGTVQIHPGGRIITFYPARGDGTVPLVSQKADFPKESLFEIPGGPEHVPAPNHEFVWKKIVTTLIASAGPN